MAGAAAALSYPVGVLLALTSAVWLLAQAKPFTQKLHAIGAASGLTLAGLGVFLIDQRLELGRWNAYLLAQRKYDHVLEQPNQLHRSRTNVEAPGADAGDDEQVVDKALNPASRALRVQKALIRVHARASAVSISWR